MPTSAEKEFTYEMINEIILLDHETGNLTWKWRQPDCWANKNQHSVNIFNAQQAGRDALRYKCHKGYLYGRVLKKRLYSHRVVYLLSNGAWPAGVVDHLNGKKNDNRMANLVDTSTEANNRNRPRQCNQSVYPGVRQVGKRWRATIGSHSGRDGKKHLGYFPTAQEAISSKKMAEEALGYNTNHGRFA